MTLAELMAAARELTPAERVLLADELLDSVEHDEHQPAVTEAAWHAEVRRRVDAIESGRAPLVDGRETMRIAREQIAARRPHPAA